MFRGGDAVPVGLTDTHRERIVEDDAAPYPNNDVGRRACSVDHVERIGIAAHRVGVTVGVSDVGNLDHDNGLPVRDPCGTAEETPLGPAATGQVFVISAAHRDTVEPSNGKAP